MKTEQRVGAMWWRVIRFKFLCSIFCFREKRFLRGMIRLGSRAGREKVKTPLFKEFLPWSHGDLIIDLDFAARDATHRLPVPSHVPPTPLISGNCSKAGNIL